MTCDCGHQEVEHDGEGCYHQDRVSRGWLLCGCTGYRPAAPDADALIARAMTVQASKLYARLHYRAELDAH